ncbi:hypothetical protein BC833DRAFT_337889 [Globomyces pollinis-pini]|nr:hypothetical protein BC833DRAFT_337889 [Globomyces pollinis-pini]
MIFYYFTYFSLLHTIFSNRIQKKHIGWVTTMFVSFITCTAFIGMIMLIGLVLYLNNSTGWNNVNKLLRVCHTISVVVITIGIIIIDLLFIKQIYINQQGIVTETKARVIYKSLLLEILFGLLVLLLTIKTTEMEFISQTYSFDWTFISWCLVNSMEIKNPVQQIKTKTLKLDVIESTKKAENSILTKADVQTTNGQLAGKSILSNSMKKSTRFDITKTPEIELE